MAGTARILSIDGGGVRALVAALVLQRIEERTRKPVAELFHLMAGTSTGGVIAAALAAPKADGTPRLTAAQAAAMYREEARTIFARSLWDGVASLGATADARYPARHLAHVLRMRLGDTRLSQALVDLLITAYDIERRWPYFFKSWKARGERLREGEAAAQRDFRLHDVGRAACAAPTYFEPARIDDARGEPRAFVDGGVFASNPAMCALAAARALYPRATRFLVVSLGTGRTQRAIPHETARDWGLLGWARPLLAVTRDGVSDTVDYQLRREFPKDYFRFQTALGVDPDDPEAANDDPDDASADNLRRLTARTEALLQAEAGELTRLIRRLRRPKDARARLVGASGAHS
ncbi:MAG: patatin [Gammaproteobacteria bacterium]|nr:patatin [Gammaproteobacteria bacterium]